MGKTLHFFITVNLLISLLFWTDFNLLDT